MEEEEMIASVLCCCQNSRGRRRKEAQGQTEEGEQDSERGDCGSDWDNDGAAPPASSSPSPQITGHNV